MKSGLLILLCVALLFSLLAPEVDGAVARGRGGGRYNKYGRRQGARRIPVQRREGRTGAAPPDADVVTDDSFADDEGAVGAAGALGDLAGICEILMFDRGEGTYSLIHQELLKFIVSAAKSSKSLQVKLIQNF